MNTNDYFVYDSDMVDTLAMRTGFGVEVLFAKIVRISEWAPGILRSPFWRAYLPLDAGGCIVHHERETPLEPGFLYLIPPETSFRAIARAPFRKIFAHFVLRVDGYDVQPGIYFQKMEEGEREAWRRSFDPRESSVADLFPLTASILRALCTHTTSTFRPHTLDGRVAAALRYLERISERGVSSREVASAAGLDYDHLSRLFRSALGETPLEAHRRLRLEAACRTLVSTDSSLDEIAERYAFSDRYHLTKLFRRRWGIGPAAYRRLVAQGRG
jgi:AraC-like DNA-binding protein